MTLFFISATLLVLLIVGWLLLGLFRSGESSVDQEAVNISLARERLKTLDAALAEGAIDQSTYDYEREQLDHDLAADLRSQNVTTSSSRGGQIATAVLVSVFIPVTAGALYLQIGNPAAITQARNAPAAPPPASSVSAEQGSPDMAQMLPKMEQRLEEQPDDIDGWRLLGRSYLSIGEFSGARRAFDKALTLDPTDVPTMALLAESIAMTQQGNMAGEPTDIVTKANALDPDDEHALWLLSIAQQQNGEHESALRGFDQLLERAAGNEQAMMTVNQMRDRSVQALSGSEPESTDTPESSAESASIDVTITISEAARAAVEDDQVVFVYATATQGPPMPLAVSRLRVNDLPVTVTLDDSMAMIPKMTLSAFPSVTVGARVSSDGNAIAQTGDWFGEQFNLDPALVGNIDIVISQQKP